MLNYPVGFGLILPSIIGSTGLLVFISSGCNKVSESVR